MPKSIWNSLRSFVLPEEVVTAKIVFDNLRNYAILAAALLGIKWYQSMLGHSSDAYLFSSTVFSPRWANYVNTTLFIMFVFLMLINLAQTAEIETKLQRSISSAINDLRQSPQSFRGLKLLTLWLAKLLVAFCYLATILLGMLVFSQASQRAP